MGASDDRDDESVFDRILREARDARSRRDGVPVGHFRCDCGEIRAWGDPDCECVKRRDETAERLEKARFLRAARSTLPEGMEWCKLGNPQWEKGIGPRQDLRKVAAEWRRDAGSFAIFGPSATGKTIALVALANRILKHALGLATTDAAFRWACKLAFVSGMDLSTARRRAQYGQEAELVSTAQHASLLLLDEIGHEVYEPAKDSTLFDVMDYRYRMGLPTLVTCGLKGRAEMLTRYGDALTRRLCGNQSEIDLWRKG